MKKVLLTAAVLLTTGAAQAITLQCSNQLGHLFTANITEVAAGTYSHTIEGLLNDNGNLVELKGNNQGSRAPLSFAVTDAEGNAGIATFTAHYPPAYGGCKRCSGGQVVLDDSEAPKMYWGLINYGNQNIHVQCNPLPN